MDGGAGSDAKRTKSTAPSDPVSGDAVDTSPGATAMSRLCTWRSP